MKYIKLFTGTRRLYWAICKIRISAHPLMFEIGRYKNLETEERLCKLCITLKIEDEYHFLINI